MFEHHKKPLISRKRFIHRMAKTLLLGISIIVVSLAIGMSGYHFIEDLSWISAFEEAAMILSGMGPISHSESTAGKLFAGLYALYSGFIIIATAAIILAPIVHRFLHRFHIEMSDQEQSQ